MEHTDYTNLVGILVGKILRNSPPLAFYLYFFPPSGRHARVSELPEFKTITAAATNLVDTFAPAVQQVWANRGTPAWYYIQLAPGHSPKQIGFYALPWSVYKTWRRVRWAW